jgi:hypothetical protein
MVGSTASLAIVIIPLAGESEVGLKTTLMRLLWPELSARGRCGPEAVKPDPVTEIEEIINIPVPPLVKVTGFVTL